MAWQGDDLGLHVTEVFRLHPDLKIFSVKCDYCAPRFVILHNRDLASKGEALIS